MKEQCQPKGTYRVVCRDRNGVEKWRDAINNVITTEGWTQIIRAFFSTGGSAAMLYMGLIQNDNFSAVAVTDTAGQINGNNGWKESGGNQGPPDYSGQRQLVVLAGFTAPGVYSGSASFNITATSPGETELIGCFLSSNQAIGSTGGFLLSAGQFTGGAQAVAEGDTLDVTWELSF